MFLPFLSKKISESEVEINPVDKYYIYTHIDFAKKLPLLHKRMQYASEYGKPKWLDVIPTWFNLEEE